MAATTEEMILVASLTDNPMVELHTLIATPSSATAKTNPTLLLLHFWGGSNRTFSRPINELRNEYNTIAPSLRGWGKSTKPADSEAYHISDYVNDIVGLLSYIRTDKPSLLRHGVVLAGHSMSGKIAQVLLTRPKIAELVKGVVLIAPAPAGSMRLPEEMREVQVRAYDSAESARGVMENVLLGNTASVGEGEVEALVQDAISGSAGAKAAWPGYGMSEDYENEVVDAVRSWPGSSLRVLVVVGALDRVEPESSVRERVVKPLRKVGIDVEVTVLEDVGHLVLIEASRELAESMRGFVGRLV